MLPVAGWIWKWLSYKGAHYGKYPETECVIILCSVVIVGESHWDLAAQEELSMHLVIAQWDWNAKLATVCLTSCTNIFIDIMIHIVTTNVLILLYFSFRWVTLIHS